jgi:hypothetical protein
VIGVADVGELKAATVAVVKAFDPSMLAAYEAERAMEHATAIKNAAAHLEAVCAARVAETDLWKRAGDRSAGDWLARKTGTTAGAAKQRMATGARIGTQDKLRRAAAEGDLSAEQAAAISDAAAADPSAEERLIGAAGRESLGELREDCDRTKAAADPDPDETHKRIRCARTLRFWSQAGVVKMFAQTTPEQMAAIKTAVEQRAEELFHGARRAVIPTG